MHGGFRAACSRASAARAERPATSTDACRRSETDPSVAAASSPPPPAAAARSVHAAGISRLLPSGSTTSSSAAPCRRMLPSTCSDRPSKGCRRRVSMTAVTVLTAAHPPRPRADPRSRQRAAPPPRPERRYSHRGRSQPPADRPEHPRRCSRRSAASASRQNTAARPHPARPPQPRSRPPHLPAAEYLPAGFHGNVEEIPAEKPRAVPDQELNSRLRGKQAFRPRAHPGGKVIEARSKSGIPSGLWITK